MAKIIAVANQKGGVGKTTTTVNVGAGLVAEGKRVLLVDIDAQANLTIALGHTPDMLDLTVANLISTVIADNELPDADQYLLSQEGMDLIPSSILLAGMDLEIQNAMSREYILKQILSPLCDRYDYILIDCSPSLGLLTLNALTAADSVLIPVQTEFLSAQGLEMLLNTISMVRRKLNPYLTVEGILYTRCERTRMGRSVIEFVNTSYAEHLKVFNAQIPKATAAAESTSAGVSIYKYQPKNPASIAYMKVVKEMISNG